MKLAQLSEDQAKLQEAAVEFARTSLGARHDPTATARRISIARPGGSAPSSACSGMPIPQEYGGLGLGSVGTARGDGGARLRARAIRGCCSRSTRTCGPTRFRSCSTAPTSSGSKYLPRLCDGSLIGANGASRARRRLGHLQHAHARDARRRPLRAERHQDVRHQRAGRRPVRRLRDGRSRARRDGHHRLHRRARHAGPDRDRQAREDGPAHVADGGSRLRRLPRAGREAARPRRPRRRRSSSARWSGSAAASSPAASA